MAVIVSVDTDSIRAAAPSGTYRNGRQLLQSQAVSHLKPGYGGVNADVTDGTITWQVWVGIIDNRLGGECDCPTGTRDRLCAHTVAAALAALKTDVTWTPLPKPRTQPEPADPEEAEFRRLARSLTRDQLEALLSRQAVRDRLVATDLKVTAGALGPAGRSDLARLRALVDKARAIPERRYEYDLHDLVAAAREFLAELQVQALRPPSKDLLAAAEYTVKGWDHLAEIVSQDWRTYANEIEEIGDSFAVIHLDLCEQLDDNPLDLADRLATLAAATGNECCLNPPEPYHHLLGPDGLNTFTRLLKQRRGW